MKYFGFTDKSKDLKFIGPKTENLFFYLFFSLSISLLVCVLNSDAHTHTHTHSGFDICQQFSIAAMNPFWYVSFVIGSALYHICTSGVMCVFRSYHTQIYISFEVQYIVYVFACVAKRKINFHINQMPIKYLFKIESITFFTLNTQNLLRWNRYTSVSHTKSIS